jgi:hypothetical protein
MRSALMFARISKGPQNVSFEETKPNIIRPWCYRDHISPRDGHFDAVAYCACFPGNEDDLVPPGAARPDLF